MPERAEESSSEDDEYSSEEDDDLVLEGELKKVEHDSEEEDSSDDGEDEEEPVAKRQKNDVGKRKSDGKKTKNSKNDASDDDSDDDSEEDLTPLNVDFIFCDTKEEYFHGLKMHLHSMPVFQPHSSALADLVIENVSVGTVIGTEDDPDDNVFGFASVLNVTTYQEQTCIQEMKKMCLKHCPNERKSELETVLSGKTKRPAGFMIHGRMVNLPLEITHVLHQQLVLDMDWAVEHAEGGEDERKSLDFGVFVLMAPCTRVNGSLIYKYFDDEVFAGRAEFTFEFDAPKVFGTEEKQVCSVIVMTKTGHRQAMKDLEELVAR